MAKTKKKSNHIPRKSRKDRDEKLAEDHDKFIAECELNGVSPILMAHYGYSR
jgi:hypothetical protein